MICNNPLCNKETDLLFKIKSGFYVCENCALISGMNKKEIEKIKKESEVLK